MIGTALRARLQGQGHKVVRVLRGVPSEPSAIWNPETGWFREGALEGVDAVVHLAGASIGEGRWTNGRRAELRSSRIDATRVLVGHLSTLKRKPDALISASAIGYYGSRGDEPLTEDSSPGAGFLAKLTRNWENEVLSARELGIRTTVLRFGVLLAKDGGALPRMMLPFKFGAGGRLGSGRQWMSWATLDDALRAIEYCLSTGTDGPVNVVAPGAVTNRDFTKTLSRVLRRPALFPVPRLALRLAVGPSADELLFASQRVVPGRLSASGFTFEQGEIEPALRAVLGR
jgi:uncharacterized protein (TIGR01777 family)